MDSTSIQIFSLEEKTQKFCANSLEISGCIPQRKQLNSFASITAGEDKPFDFLGALFEGFVAGGTAGVVAEAALYPIDTIKTRLQAAHGGGKIMLKDLYSGLGGNLVGSLPASAIFVGVYEPLKQKLLKTLPENLSAVAHLVRSLPYMLQVPKLTFEKSIANLVVSKLFSAVFQDFIQTAGVVGGAISSIIRVPTEVVKQRLQTGQFSSTSNAVRLIVAKDGFRGLYAGYRSFLLRDLPFDAVQFCIYEQLMMGYKLAAQRDLKGPEIALVGAFAGAITGAMTTPLDVVKTRLMVQGSGHQYAGIFDCLQTISKEEGFHALLKGIGPRVVWIGIGGSIFFGVLEKTKQVLAQRCPRPVSFKQD